MTAIQTLCILNFATVLGIYGMNLPSLQMDATGRVQGSRKIAAAEIITGTIGGLLWWAQLALTGYVFWRFGLMIGLLFLLAGMVAAGAMRLLLRTAVGNSRSAIPIILACLVLGTPLTLISGLALLRHLRLI